MPKTTYLTVRVRDEHLRNTLESLISHVGPANKSIDSRSAWDLFDPTAKEVAIQCHTENVQDFLRRAREWLGVHPKVSAEVVDSGGHVLLKVDPPPPKIRIEPLKLPDNLPDASFDMERRIPRFEKPSTRTGQIRHKGRKEKP